MKNPKLIFILFNTNIVLFEHTAMPFPPSAGDVIDVRQIKEGIIADKNFLTVKFLIHRFDILGRYSETVVVLKKHVEAYAHQTILNLKK